MAEDDPEIEVVPPHESPLRRAIADSSGGAYVAYATLEEARRDPDAALVMEGDWGGQVYLACPLSVVMAHEAALGVLLRDIDAVAWDNPVHAAGMRYERLPAGSGVWGGMGGGLVTADIWVHPEFVRFELDDAIRRVIRGQQDRIPRDVMEAAIAIRDRLSLEGRHWPDWEPRS